MTVTSRADGHCHDDAARRRRSALDDSRRAGLTTDATPARVGDDCHRASRTTDAARPALLSSVTVTIRSVQVRGGRVHRNRIFKPAVSRFRPFIPGGVIVWTEDDEFRAFSSGWRLKSFFALQIKQAVGEIR